MPGLIPPEFLDRVRQANNIVDVIGGYFPLRNNGANFVALCPFHREKTPSFNVSPHRQIYYCFGCHKGGDVINFVKDYESLGFVDAVKRLAQRGGIPFEFDQGPGQQAHRELKDALFQIHEQITQRWHLALLNDASAEPARAYLKQRDVSTEAVEVFRLGYAPDEWDDTVNWAKAKGFESDLLQTSGLVVHKEESNRVYDRFRGRLIFPIADEQGRVIAFSGRLLDAEAKAAKYVNSPETPIFTKGRVFFGLDKTKRAILDARQVIVCEGQLDLMRCYMAGVRNMVAPQGTALTSDHARILKRYVQEVVLCFDSDEAGQNAAARSFESLAAVDLAVRVATVPSPHDPDSLIREQGAAAFQKVVADAVEYFDFLLKRLCEKNDPATDRGRIAVLQGMAPALQKSNNPVIIDAAVQRIALRLGVAVDAVRQEMRSQARSATRYERFDSAEADEADAALDEINPPFPEPEPLEHWLTRIVLTQEEVLDWLVEHLDPDWIANSGVREIVEQRLAHPEHGVAALLQELPGDAHRRLASEIATEAIEIPDPARQARDLVLRLRNQHYDRELLRLRTAAAASDLDEATQMNLLRRQQEIRAAKRLPLEPLADA